MRNVLYILFFLIVFSVAYVTTDNVLTYIGVPA